MEINEIKKALYKEKPKAEIIHVSKEGVLYECDYFTGERDADKRGIYSKVYFLVPLDDMGETAFLKEMPAQLLIRYIITEPSY